MYPKWKYHTAEPAKIFRNAQEELDAGEGWVESPSLLSQLEEIIEENVEKITSKFKKTKKFEESEELKPEIIEPTGGE